MNFWIKTICALLLVLWVTIAAENYNIEMIHHKWKTNYHYSSTKLEP
jgi:hypothetical protein